MDQKSRATRATMFDGNKSYFIFTVEKTTPEISFCLLDSDKMGTVYIRSLYLQLFGSDYTFYDRLRFAVVSEQHKVAFT